MSSPSNDEYFIEAIRSRLEKVIEVSRQHVIETAVNSFREQISEKVAKVSIDLLSFVTFERLGNELLIRVDTSKIKGGG